MSGRRRHHFIPRFLLNRFASRREGRKAWVWQFDRTRARELSTKDVAVSRDFYGGPASTLEDDLAEHEGAWASALGEVERTGDCRPNIEALRAFVWTLAIRGRAIRSQLGALPVRIVQRALTPERALLLQEQSKARMLERLEGDLSSLWDALPPDIAAAVRAKLASDPDLERQIREQMMQIVPSLEVADDLIAATHGPHVREGFQSTARTGLVQGLAGFVSSEPTPVPESFRPAKWRVLDAHDQEIVLGDLCVIALRDDRTAGGVLGRPSEWRQLYLPISRHKVLVMDRSEDQVDLSLDELNQLSFDLAHEHVFGGTDGAGFRAHMPRIGTRDPTVSDEEIDAYIQARLPT